MPKIFIHAAQGTFDPPARQAVASELTDLALECERLPKSPLVTGSVWTYFNEYPAEAIFMGGAPASPKPISVQVYSLDGGLEAGGRGRLIEGATAILAPYCQVDGRPAPVFIVIHEVRESHWGIAGRTGNLAAMRASPLDAPAPWDA
jgi:phenylpyruvate tautomerase PptA (4-oxalocrotonate tautomerase family)